ncbi:MAG: hypothetical protein QOC70_1172 [Verrucomicrobiota bacterium]|jgi:hypothetical protein
MTTRAETLKSAPARANEPTQWWFFCLLLVSLKLFLLALDPLPKLFIGDSACYISTALAGWIPDDRSYFYGYVIRWVALWTGSLTSLLLLQSFISALTALVLAYTCRSVIGLSMRASFVFGLLCALDPLQLVWERYVMTETISLFLYVTLLYFSFLYLKRRGIRHLVIVQGLSVLLIGFRMSYLLVVQVNAVLLPTMAFFPILLAAWRSRRGAQAGRFRALRLAFVHVVTSIGVMLLLHGAYRQANGLLCDREPAYLYATGLHLLAFWAPILTPADASDERLARIIEQGDEFDIKDLTERNNQRFESDYLVDRWQQVEFDTTRASQIAKETAVRALRRNPLQVLRLAAQTFAQYWNLRDLRHYAIIDLGHHDLTPEQNAMLAESFHFATDGRIIGAPPTFLQRFFLISWPYCYFVLLSPLLGISAVYLARERQIALLLLLHLVIILGVTFTFAVAPSLRYLQPASLLTLLTVALCLRSFLARRSPAELAPNRS